MADPYHPAYDIARAPPHPLVYASLEPCYSSRRVKRMDLHKPKTTYTVGRGPLNDFVLDDEQSGQIGEYHQVHDVFALRQFQTGFTARYRSWVELSV